MKKALSLWLVIGFVAVFAISVSANTSSDTSNEKANEQSEVKSIESLEYMTDQELENAFKKPGNQRLLLTYKQMIDRVMELQGLTRKEAMEKYPHTIPAEVPEAVKKAHAEKTSFDKKSTVSISSSSTCDYVVDKQSQPITWEYMPDLETAIKHCYSGSFTWLQDIWYSQYDLSYAFDVKEYKGDTRATLFDDQSGYYYNVNGHFYDLGTTTKTAEAGVNTAAYSATFGVSEASNHYAYYDSDVKRVTLLNR